MEVLNTLEYGMSLQFLVDLGNWFGAVCTDKMNGEWIRLADNTYECVNTDLDRRIAEWLEGLLPLNR